MALVEQITELENALNSLLLTGTRAEKLIDHKYRTELLKLDEIFKQINEMVNQWKTGAESSLSESVQMQKAELNTLTWEIRALKEALTQLAMRMNAGNALDLGLKINELDSNIRQAQFDARLTSLYNFRLCPNARMSEVHGLLNKELCYVQRCALNPSDISLHLETAHPSVAALVTVNMNCINAPADCRLGHMLSVQVSSDSVPSLHVDIDPNNSKLTFVPNESGDYTVAVRLYGEHVSGSPLRVSVLLPLVDVPPFIINNQQTLTDSTRHPMVTSFIDSNSCLLDIDPLRVPNTDVCSPISPAASNMRAHHVDSSLLSQSAEENQKPDLDNNLLLEETKSNASTWSQNIVDTQSVPEAAGGADLDSQSASIILSVDSSPQFDLEVYSAVEVLRDRAVATSSPRRVTMQSNNIHNETFDWDDAIENEIIQSCQENSPALSSPCAKPDLSAILRESGNKGIHGRRLHMFGEFERTDGSALCLSFPMGVSYMQNDNLWMICDSGHGVVKLFDVNGELRQTIGANKKLDRPSAAQYVPYTDEFVVKDEHGLYIFNRRGEFIATLAKLNRPMGLVLYNDRVVLTLADANVGLSAEIRLYSVPERKICDRWPYTPNELMTQEGRKNSQPRFIDARDKIMVVTDLGRGVEKTHKISLETGHVLLTWGKYGSRPGEWMYPSGIELDGVGNMLIGDAKNDRIQLFDSSGSFLCVLNLGWPGARFVSDICLTGDAKLMVSCRKKATSVLYQLEPLR